MLQAIVFEELRVAITGGTSGLGLALVRQLSARGARVAFVARTPAAVARTAADTAAHGIVGDVGRKEDIHPIALQVTGALGGLDILVNNASSLGPTPLAPLADTECEDLEAALAVNLVGPFRLTKALFGSLAQSAREGRGALVVNISSDAATRGRAPILCGAPTGRARRPCATLPPSGPRRPRRSACASCRSIPATWPLPCTSSRSPTPTRRNCSAPRKQAPRSWTGLLPHCPAMA
jgi:NAD(P)-dependent dehydrogenase (short-subunit alcohol dehydrogenase family)